MSYWNFNPTFTEDNTARWELDTSKLFQDVMDGMRQREEDATMHVVIEYLRGRGYTVIEPGEGILQAEKLSTWLEYAIETSLKTAKEVKEYEAPPSYWQGRAEAYKLVSSLLRVGKFDGIVGESK